MAAVHPLAARRPCTMQRKPRPLAASAHALPPSLPVDARQRGRGHSQSRERGRRGRLGGERRPWRPKTHVPLTRVRNFRVREGFTSGRELDTYFTNVCLLHAIVRVFYSLCTRGAGLRADEVASAIGLHWPARRTLGSALLHGAAPWEAGRRRRDTNRWRKARLLPPHRWKPQKKLAGRG